MEIILAISLGIGLSAACGFRVFVPPLVLSAASVFGEMELSPQLDWIGTLPALLVFAAAAATEAIAYYIPVLDNFLDVLEAPLALVAGTAISASLLGDLDPVLQWTLAAIAGGGTAGAIEGFTGVARLTSTATTGGLGNPLLSTAELLSSLVLSLLAMLVPILAAIVVVGLLVFAGKTIAGFLARRRRDRAAKSSYPGQ